MGPDDETARLHYAEAMALTVYLMEGRGGKYREGFLDYVRDALRGPAHGATAATSSTTASGSPTRSSTPSSLPT